MATTVLERHEGGVFYFRYYVYQDESYPVAVSETDARLARAADIALQDDATLERRAEYLATLVGAEMVRDARKSTPLAIQDRNDG